MRGKHMNQKKVDDNIKNGIRRHIDSIPRIESHYLRQQTSREFIYSGKSLSELFRDYKRDCDMKQVPSDQCDLCNSYRNALGDHKEQLAEKYDLHQKEKELSRLEKQMDKEKIKENFIVACYDLQAVLPSPRGDTSIFYYKSKLNSFNFTICEMKSGKVECFFWHEAHGGRGANEIGTCVLKYLQETAESVNTEELEVIFYSDNCCGQQKNRFLFGMYMHAVAKLKIKAITHKFLIRGHTQNEGDNAHSVIEKAVKRYLKSGPIYEPSNYVSIIRSAKKTGGTFFITFRIFLTQFLQVRHIPLTK
ncbi:hypothetical protein ABEB36_012945 [Hypothenemus hampei]|uniref:DUF7869 domain-containing protein n=1 Tax=Hypothenemus hampei TaxID=57062 RepID=A0ABD1E6K8_HYPHA